MKDPYRYTDHPLPQFPSKKKPEWATFIKMRTPQFKMHTMFGHAKNAIVGGGILYRWVEERWLPVAIVNEGQFKNHELWRIPGLRPTEPVATWVIQEEP